MMASTSRRPAWLAVAIAVAVTAAAGCTTGAGSKGRPAQGAPVDGARTNGLENRTNGLENRSAAQVQKEVGAALKTAQEEGEQDLDAGLGDPELLEQLGEVAVDRL